VNAKGQDLPNARATPSAGESLKGRFQQSLPRLPLGTESKFVHFIALGHPGAYKWRTRAGSVFPIVNGRVTGER